METNEFHKNKLFKIIFFLLNKIIMSLVTQNLYFFFETDVSEKIKYQDGKIDYDKDFFKKYIDTCKNQLEKILRESTTASPITIQNIKSVLIIDKTSKQDSGGSVSTSSGGESGGGSSSGDSSGSSSKTTIKLRIYVPVKNDFDSSDYNYVTEHDNVSLYTVDIQSASTQQTEPQARQIIPPQLQQITPRTQTSTQSQSQTPRTQTSTQVLTQQQKNYKKLKFVYRYVKKNILLEPLFFIYKTSDQQNQQQVQVNKIIYRINSKLVLAIPSIDPYTSFPSVQDQFTEICEKIGKIQTDYKFKKLF
jgi:hypothetical protein